MIFATEGFEHHRIQKIKKISVKSEPELAGVQFGGPTIGVGLHFFLESGQIIQILLIYMSESFLP